MTWVKVDVADCCCIARLAVLDRYGLEERWYDKVNILSSIGEESHHDESLKRSHGATIVIAGYANDGIVEQRGNVLMGAFSRESRTSSVMV